MSRASAGSADRATVATRRPVATLHPPEVHRREIGLGFVRHPDRLCKSQHQLQRPAIPIGDPPAHQPGCGHMGVRRQRAVTLPSAGGIDAGTR